MRLSKSGLLATVLLATTFICSPLLVKRLESQGGIQQPAHVLGAFTADDCLKANSLGFVVSNGTTCPTGGYNQSTGPATAVSMNGTDVTILTLSNVSALAAGSCYGISWGTGTGLDTATIKIKAGSTTISTPWILAGAFPQVTGTVKYCNNPGVQNAQVLYYQYPLWYNTVSTFPSQITAPIGGGDGWVNTPSAVDWSTTHNIILTVNQPSGTVVPEFLSVSFY